MNKIRPILPVAQLRILLILLQNHYLIGMFYSCGKLETEAESGPTA